MQQRNGSSSLRKRSSFLTRSKTSFSCALRPAVVKASRASPGQPPGKSRRLSGSLPPGKAISSP
jgi:hypothetical protein